MTDPIVVWPPGTYGDPCETMVGRGWYAIDYGYDAYGNEWVACSYFG